MQCTTYVYYTMVSTRPSYIQSAHIVYHGFLNPLFILADTVPRFAQQPSLFHLHLSTSSPYLIALP